jgi:pre-mRNA-splicing factor 18
MLPRLAEIVHHMQKRQYQRANDAYLRLSIGNAPWPIGVTMVGYVLAPSPIGTFLKFER